MRTIKIELTLSTDDKDLEAELIAECNVIAEDFDAQIFIDTNPEEDE